MLMSGSGFNRAGPASGTGEFRRKCLLVRLFLLILNAGKKS